LGLPSVSDAFPTLKSQERNNSLSFRLGQYEDLKESALDPYVAFRDAYIQYRRALVQD